MPIIGALMGLFFLSGGIAGMPAAAGAPSAPLQPTYTVALTAYNAVPEQTDSDPHITASGAFSNPEIIAARSRDLATELPFGTIIAVDGPPAAQHSCGFDVVRPLVGYRVIADTMNARYTDRVDLLFSTEDNFVMAGGRVKNAGMVLGICDAVTIRVVGFVDISNPAKAPKTQSALAAIVARDSALALK